MAIYGYVRKAIDEEDLQLQMEELLAADVKQNTIFFESAAKANLKHPEFNKLIKQASPGDTLVVTKLDRLANNPSEALEFIELLLDRDIAIRILDLGLLENNSMGTMIINLLTSLVEMEE